MRYIMIIVAVSLLGACSSMGTTYQIKSESGDVVNTVPKWYMADIKESRACDTSMFTKKTIIKYVSMVWVPFHLV